MTQYATQYLAIGGRTNDAFGRREALRVRVGYETSWTWKDVTDDEYQIMLDALNAPRDRQSPDNATSKIAPIEHRKIANSLCDIANDLSDDWTDEKRVMRQAVEALRSRVPCPPDKAVPSAQVEPKGCPIPGACACIKHVDDPAEIARVRKFLAKVHDVLRRRFPKCHDCADDGPNCPQSGLPCDLETAFNFVLALLPAQAQAGEAWRPIETAPRDGSDFLACHGETGDMIVMFYSGPSASNPNYCWSRTDGPTYHQDFPTHWLPLPAPPPSQSRE